MQIRFQIIGLSRPKMQLTFFLHRAIQETAAAAACADGPINSFFWPGTLSSFIFFWLHKESDASKNSKNYFFFEHQKRNMNLIITHTKNGSKFENFGGPKVFALFKIESFYLPFHILWHVHEINRSIFKVCFQ